MNDSGITRVSGIVLVLLMTSPFDHRKDKGE